MGVKFRGRGIVTKEEVLHHQTDEQIATEQTVMDKFNHLFKGKIVTSDMQQRLVQSKNTSSASTLFTIIEDPDYIQKFGKYEFPKFMKMESGEYFFEPIMRVVSPLASRYVKFFSPLADLSIPNDHDYEYARLHNDGYLMRVEVNRHIDEIVGFEISYVTPVLDVEVTSCYTARTTGATVFDAQRSTMPEKAFRVTPFNPAQYLQLQNFLYHPEIFIEKYLQDVMEKI